MASDRQTPLQRTEQGYGTSCPRGRGIHRRDVPEAQDEHDSYVFELLVSGALDQDTEPYICSVGKLSMGALCGIDVSA